MDRRLVLGFYSLYSLLFVIPEVKGTLTPSNAVSVDCGNQQTFTCSISDAAAGWTITGLDGIIALGSTGLSLGNNDRITTTDTRGDTRTSTITITGFTTVDNRGTVQCINQGNNTVQGMATVSVGTLPCPTSITSNRTTDFTSATVMWSEPATYPVTYCPTSSPNCGNSMTCTSPCTINELNPCLNYSVTVTPSNNCGNTTGCMMTTVDSLSKGVPKCVGNISFQEIPGERCLTIFLNPNDSLATMLMIDYYSTVTPDDRKSSMCNLPLRNCDIGNLQPTTYMFTFSPGNECGFATGCQSIAVPINRTDCVSVQPVGCDASCRAGIGGGIGAGLVLVIIIIVVIVVVCYCCPSARSACCCCVSNGSKRSTSTEPMKPRPGEEYADPQKVRENKESGKQGGITYAALEFSEQAGSTGGQNVRSKDQPVQYMAVEHA